MNNSLIFNLDNDKKNTHEYFLLQDKRRLELF